MQELYDAEVNADVVLGLVAKAPFTVVSSVTITDS